MTWYFYDRYKLNTKTRQYVSRVFALKREVQDKERLFLNNTVEYIQNNSKRAKNSIEMVQEKNNESKTLNSYFNDFIEYELKHNKGALHTHTDQFGINIFQMILVIIYPVKLHLN